MNWKSVIGLEIHVQLATESKLFSGASIDYGAAPNTQACIVDLGMPGVLPVVNKTAIYMAAKFGLAVNATINSPSVFARKNYFYPDLPKGYQISQYELPIVENGKINITLNDGKTKTVRITRAHLEEDAGKSIHEGFGECTAIDLNRAGTPLIEIVSEPDMQSAEEAAAYMKKIHSLVQYLEISDGNMQEGSFRCDANVSICPKDASELGTRTEIKNINSFRFVELAINFEIERQKNLLESGGKVIQETRLYDSIKNETRSMRTKEEADDYRYFPDPDLLPVEISIEDIEKLRQKMPELPDAKCNRFIEELGLSKYDSINLTSTKEIAIFFEQTMKTGVSNSKLCANWIMGDLSAALNKNNLTITESPVSPHLLGAMLCRIEDKTISGKIAKQVFEAIWKGEGDANTIIEAKGLRQVTDSDAIEEFVDTVISDHSEQVQQYKTSSPEKQKKLIGFFIGQVMKKSQGKANPQQVNSLLGEKLKS